uniref:DUF1995 domain-containing protein n=1 Tax=Fibrocapsa japonica TaxID=94617 RepID=A0A7S2XUE4_9STRA|mmetsp:Transcript_10007/g.15236  ORF Transcript_10007/g.15236 Transcript_10007/m.15236 type:complete len:287 (+) Transcript_10007:36-896(+)
MAKSPYISIMRSLVVFTILCIYSSSAFSTNKLVGQHGMQTRTSTSLNFFGMGGGGSAGAKTGVPTSYEEVHKQAVAAVGAAIKKGEKKMEVEFPPLAALNKLGDGSAKSAKMIKEANAEFAKKLVTSLTSSRSKVWVVCCEPGYKKMLEEAIGTQNKKVEVVPLSSRNLPDASPKDVLIFLTPGDDSQWKIAAKLGETAPVVVVNGLFNNGYGALEPVYYLKPFSGWGYLMRQFPNDFTVYLTGEKKPLDLKVTMMEMGNLRRPDSTVVGKVLQSEFMNRAGKQRK